MKPFITKSLVEPKGIDKLLKKIPVENFIVEVNNLLANHSLDEISAGQVQQLADKYKLKDASQTFKSELLQMLKDFISQHLGVWGDEYKDFSSVQKLQNILGISEGDFDKEYNPLAIELFKKQVALTLNQTKKYKESDQQFEQLRTQFGLTKHQHDQVLDEVRQSIVQTFACKIISDQRVSPQEKEAFDQLCKDLDVNPVYDSDSKKTLERFENLWQIENGDLPIYEADIFLQKNENCHYQGSAKLFEIRTKSARVKYRGPTVRLRITKSLYYRMGDIKTTRETKDVMTLIDSGNLYVTNKRILFNGDKSNKIIRYSQIINLTPYTDGVGIVRDTGKESTFQLSEEDGETLIATITRLIGDEQ
mgnify:CR=1 FL=1